MTDPVDDELRVTAALAARRRDELAAEGRPVLAGYFAELAAVAAEARAERRALARAVDAAGVVAVDISDLLRLEETG
jgi:hypothetical protein